MVNELASVSNILYSIFADLQVIGISGKDAALCASIQERLRASQGEVERIKAALIAKEQETQSGGNS